MSKQQHTREREKSQDLREEFEEKYKKIVDLSLCGIVMVDLNGKVVSCIRAAVEGTIRVNRRSLQLHEPVLRHYCDLSP
jgi:PAS domain-containing protein